MENFILHSKGDNLPLTVSMEIPKGKIKGIIQISHGMAEHKKRYYPFMKFLADQGYMSIIHDHRGHGQSIKRNEDLGYFYEKHANLIVEDLKDINQYIKKLYPNLKRILFGHSMGSLVVRKFIQKYDKEIDGLIICGSPSENKMVSIGMLFTKGMSIFFSNHHRSKFIQNLAFGSFDKKFKSKKPNVWICSNPKIVDEYNQDPLCGFIFTLNGFQNLFSLMKDVYHKKNYQGIKKDLPILFIAGSDDPVIISEKKWLESQTFLSQIGYQQMKHIMYPKMRHEILNELKNKKVYQDIIEWMENDGSRN